MARSSLLALATLLCVSCSQPPDPLPGFPKLVLWAWERGRLSRHDLHLRHDQLGRQPRLHPLLIPPGTRLIGAFASNPTARSNFPHPVWLLQSVLADPAQAAIHRQAGDLLQFAQGRLNPAQLIALSKRLLTPDSTTLAHDLNDYTYFFDRFENGSNPDPPPGHAPGLMQADLQTRIAALQSITTQDDLTEWILQFQNVWPKSRNAIIHLAAN